MIVLSSGNIFESEADALVNPVNTVGSMGAGLALEFKRRFPGVFREYRKACMTGDLRVGEVLSIEENGRFVVCLPTKQHFAEKSRLSYVESGLVALLAELTAKRLGSVAIPALGCGLGGLDWADVRPLTERAMSRAPLITTYLYPPQERSRS